MFFPRATLNDRTIRHFADNRRDLEDKKIAIKPVLRAPRGINVLARRSESRGTAICTGGIKIFDTDKNWHTQNVIRSGTTAWEVVTQAN